MRFKIEPDKDGYFLYVLINNKWELIGFKFTLIGARISAWRYKRHCKKSGEFKL